MSSWLIVLDTCPSTNTWAVDHVAALAHGAVVWTTRQTAGRGRQGRSWLAPAGVLTASVVIDLPGEVNAGPMALAAGLAVIHACEDHLPYLGLGLKWPNDVVRGGHKLAGILCERAGGPRPALVIGIGLNRDPQWTEPPPIPVASLADGGVPPDDIALLHGIRRYLLEAAGLVADGGFARLLPQIADRDALSGQVITVVDGERRVTGTAVGIAADGALLIETGNGRLAVSSGHVLARALGCQDGQAL
jgi:BirA family biotin operon repressor/biotin-[acetyl-CoA-carboxylase] ligase